MTCNVLISISQAATLGIERLRKPIWVCPEDHVKIDIIDGKPGPWTRLFSPSNTANGGRDPIKILCVDLNYDAEEWVPHTGPVADSDAYRAAVSNFKRLTNEL